MTTDQLYEIILDEGIILYRTPLPHNRSVSISIGNGYYVIGLDTAHWSEAEERVHLAHEIGHCLCNAFYHPYASLRLRRKQEYMAKRWAVDRLIPWDELYHALLSGITAPWELADHFDVNEDFVSLALDFYTRDGKLPIRTQE